MNDHEFRGLIETVRERTDIVQVIGQYVNLNRYHKALCPFHEEKTPSFSVNPKGQYFRCFGCEASGDVFTFLMRIESKQFMDVLRNLARDAGVPWPELRQDDHQRFEETRIIEDILTATAQYYQRSLTAKACDYLVRERGITEESISRFRIGYAAGGLSEHLIGECRFQLEACVRAGVLKESPDRGIRDYFYKRMIFPHLKRGRVVNITGRSLNGREPKYLHLPGRIEHLYNEDVLTNKSVFVAEGILDCLSAEQNGYPTVATLGTSNLKQEYLPKFSRCEIVYLCFDGDNAGEQGALKVGGMIGERAKIVQLPAGLDLNDYFREHSKNDFDSLVSDACDIIRYELSLIPPDTDKTELPRLLEPILQKLSQMDRAKAEAYLSYEIKSRFKLKKEDIDGYRSLLKKCQKETAKGESASSEAEREYTALFKGLVDLVEQDGSVAFLVKDEDRLSVQSEIEIDDKLYVPPPKEQIPWLLPRADEVLTYYELQDTLSPADCDRALYDDLLVYHKSISELPSEEYYDLVVAWDIHTYLCELFQYSPILCLFAVPERGKSRTGKGMIHVAYHGIHVESLRDAYLVRVANDLHASLFFDVKDIWKKAEKNGSEDILLHRFEKGAKVPRVLYPERGAHNDIVYYTIFGPTIIGTNEGVHRILETRAVSVNMPETVRQFENDVTPQTSRPLKERLVAFRARHLGEMLQDIPKPATGRLGDILKPLQQVIRLVRPEREGAFLELVKLIQSEKAIEKADSIEALILVAVIKLADEVENGKLPVKRITDSLNEGRSERNKLSYQLIGRRLSALSFKKAKTGDGASAILWDEKNIERMKDAYGLRETSVSSERSET